MPGGGPPSLAGVTGSTGLSYTKPVLSPADLLAHMVARGLAIPDRAAAINVLEYVGYYRLLIYMRALQSPGQQKWFNPGGTFDQLMELYNFDRELRLLCMDGIERIEVALRAAINNRLGASLGPHFYENPTNFFIGGSFKHLEFLAKVDGAQSLGLSHYRQTYTAPVRPPVWVALEAVTLGTLSRMYSGLLTTHQQSATEAHA